MKFLTKTPVALWALALASFGIGTTELVPMGLLPVIAQDLDVSLFAAGMLITGYALGVVAGVPIIAVLSAKIRRKTLLLLLVGGLAFGNLLCAWAPNYTLLMIGALPGHIGGCSYHVTKYPDESKTSGQSQKRGAYGMNNTNFSEKPMLVEVNVPVTMRDGSVLRADIYRPHGEGPWPVLLTRMPYGKDNDLFIFDDVPRAVQNGYMVILQDTRGRFASEGEWDPILTAAHEGSDSYETIEWAAKLPHSNGRVGMFGTSYYAFTQWAGMLHNPASLLAAVPALSWSDPFDGFLYRGGALELGFLAYWQLGMQRISFRGCITIKKNLRKP